MGVENSRRPAARERNQARRLKFPRWPSSHKGDQARDLMILETVPVSHLAGPGRRGSARTTLRQSSRVLSSDDSRCPSSRDACLPQVWLTVATILSPNLQRSKLKRRPPASFLRAQEGAPETRPSAPPLPSSNAEPRSEDLRRTRCGSAARTRGARLGRQQPLVRRLERASQVLR